MDWLKDKLRGLLPENMSEETADKITSGPFVVAVVVVFLLVSFIVAG